jgi:hypothetical protein
MPFVKLRIRNTAGEDGNRYWVRAYSEVSLKLTLAGISQTTKMSTPRQEYFMSCAKPAVFSEAKHRSKIA